MNPQNEVVYVFSSQEEFDSYISSLINHMTTWIDNKIIEDLSNFNVQ